MRKAKLRLELGVCDNIGWPTFFEGGEVDYSFANRIPQVHPGVPGWATPTMLNVKGDAELK